MPRRREKPQSQAVQEADEPRDGSFPNLKLPDVVVKQITINGPEYPKTANCCYCCCAESGLYYE